MIEAILTDIEGTTSSITFVKDVLFPYSHINMERFIKEYWDDSQIQALLRSIFENSSLREFTPDCLIHCLRNWIEKDEKKTSLKHIQGLIWEDGYKKGLLKGHIYEDAYNCLHQWKEKGLSLFVFSSGSILAQKLLFKYSQFGDLTSLFSGYFDTTIGSKREILSYQKIANMIGKDPNLILFLSDTEEEIACARHAGMKVLRISRDDSLKDVRNFYEIDYHSGHSIRSQEALRSQSTKIATN